MHITRSLVALVLLLTVVQPAHAFQRARRTAPPPLPTLDDVGPARVLAALRGGGHILACRHAITDRSGGRRGPVEFNDRSTQRNLSAAGEEQARRLGRAIAALEIPIGEVDASPYARTMETAQLAFGRATPDRMLYGSRSADAFRERFNRKPSEGNAVLMTHQGILRSVLGYREPGEGDCIVLRPTSDGPQVVSNVTVPEWERLAAESGRRP
jgi:broad specificity phosphatase PhoE